MRNMDPLHKTHVLRNLQPFSVEFINRFARSGDVTPGIRTIKKDGSVTPVIKALFHLGLESRLSSGYATMLIYTVGGDRGLSLSRIKGC